MTEFSELPTLERVQRYREMAIEARQAGNRSTGHMRESYFLISERWENLATDAEVAEKSKPATED